MKSMKISEALRKERKSLGLTQGQMIKESKISVTHYSKMEMDKMEFLLMI